LEIRKSSKEDKLPLPFLIKVEVFYCPIFYSKVNLEIALFNIQKNITGGRQIMRSKKLYQKSISIVLFLAFLISSCYTQVFASNATNVQGQVNINPSDVEFSESQLLEDIDTSVANSVYSDSKDIQFNTDILRSKKTNRFIIKYKNKNRRGKVLNKIKGKLRSARNSKNKKFDIVSTELTLNDFVEEMENSNVSEEIEYIQPDYEITLSSNDTNYVTQWGIENSTIDQLGFNIDSNVVDAWNETEGEGVTVAVIDTGVDITHKDLENNVWVNEKEIPDNNIDDDFNGYVDDYLAWNFYDDTNEVYNNEMSYDLGHGTHIAGVISSEKDNDFGITGVSPKTKIMSLKAFSNGVARTSDIIEAIEYAQNMNARVVNCSWGTQANNIALRETMENSDMLFVCAAGNSSESIDTECVYPACFGLENTISVASINKKGELSSFSNYGEENVDIAAPGEDITSTLPGNRIGQKSGTSIATPFVSGEAALMFSKYPDLSAKEIKDRIINSSDRLSTLEGKVKRANKINITNAILDIVNDELIELRAAAKDVEDLEEVEEVVEESVSESVYDSAVFNTFDSAVYSNGQETTSNMFGIPTSAMNGVFSAVVKGNTRTNRLLSPEMNKDSDKNGVVNNFIKELASNVPAVYSLDDANSCQKIELKSSTANMNGAKVYQWFPVNPGEKVDVSLDAKVSGNVKVKYYTAWFNGSSHLGSTPSVYCDSTYFTTIQSLNIEAPANTTRAQFIIRLIPLDNTSTGSIWVKNAVAEKSVSGQNFITSGTKATEATRIKSVGKNLFSNDMFYNMSRADVKGGSVSVENNKLKFVSTSSDAYIITRNSYVAGTKSPKSHNKYDIPVTSSPMYYTRKIENMTEGNTNEYIYYYDKDKRLISYARVATSVNGTKTNKLIPPSNAKYLHIRLGATKSGQTIYYSDLMLSSENIAYKPYRESATYIPVELNSMSDKIKDEIDLNTGLYTKRVEKVTVNKGDWLWQYSTGFNEYEYELDATSILPGAVISVDGVDCVYSSGTSDDFYWTDANKSKIGNSNITLKYTDYTVPSQVTILYPLANPVVKKLDITPVTSFSGGTVFVENAVKKVSVYNNGIAINDKELKISEIESVYKIKNGEKTPVNLSNVTTNSECTAFTISGAVWGEMYEYVYKYESYLSTLPTIQYSFPTSIEAQVENNALSIGQQSQLISSLVEQVNSLKEQIDNPKRVVAGPFDISCRPATPFNVVLTAANTKDFSSRKFTVVYNTDEVTVKDLCAATSTLETGVCNPVGTNISIVKVQPGLIEFIVYNPVDVGMSWSGAVNSVVFTPKSGVYEARITYIAE